MSKEKTNVYIATLPRSGSTMLGMILGNHSRIFHIGESFYWNRLNPKDVKCFCGKKNCEVLVSIQKRIGDFPEIGVIYETCSLIDKIQEPEKICHSFSLSDNSQQKKSITSQELNCKLDESCVGLEKLADIFRNVIGDSIIVDNTKVIHIAEHLVKKDNWKILLLTRDPRGLAYSNKKSGIRKNVPRPLQMKIPVYIDFANRALRLCKLKNVFCIKYENLCQNPSEKLTEICNFIGIPFENPMLKFKADRGHALMGNRMRFDDNQQIQEDLNWVIGLNYDEKNMIYRNSELTDLFKQLGYCLKE